MARNHFIKPTVPENAGTPVRLGAGNTANDRYDYLEQGKTVKLVGSDRYALTAAGDGIEGVVYAVELAPQNGYSIGTVYKPELLDVTFDGLQATPGTGVAAVGDIVVAGTQTAKGTALPGPVRVCVATTPAGVNFKYRVVSLGAVGTGAVGTTGVVERI